jgi:hypothetical protein
MTIRMVFVGDARLFGTFAAVVAQEHCPLTVLHDLHLDLCEKALYLINSY